MDKPAKLGSDLDINYQRFFEESLHTGCVWGLEGPEGWALCESEKYSDTLVMPFWSQPEYAAVHCNGDWSSYQPIAVSMEEFLDDWLTGMHEDVTLVGINWTEKLEGEECEPLDLLHEFEEILK